MKHFKNLFRKKKCSKLFSTLWRFRKKNHENMDREIIFNTLFFNLDNAFGLAQINFILMGLLLVLRPVDENWQKSKFDLTNQIQYDKDWSWFLVTEFFQFYFANDNFVFELSLLETRFDAKFFSFQIKLYLTKTTALNFTPIHFQN